MNRGLVPPTALLATTIHPDVDWILERLLSPVHCAQFTYATLFPLHPCFPVSVPAPPPSHSPPLSLFATATPAATLAATFAATPAAARAARTAGGAAGVRGLRGNGAGQDARGVPSYARNVEPHRGVHGPPHRVCTRTKFALPIRDFSFRAGLQACLPAMPATAPTLGQDQRRIEAEVGQLGVS